MSHLNYGKLYNHVAHSQPGTFMKNVMVVFCLALLVSVLASCGATATGQTSQPTPIPTPTLAPSPTVAPTHVVSPTPTPRPTPKPTVAPQPTQPPVAPQPPVLDLRPLSMSFVGHLDCNHNGAYVCLARVISESNAQSNLHWSAFTNVPGHIVFSPSSGVLTPGQGVLVAITIPLNACTPGLFFFRGPINTHTITWAC
ncbi:MAG TPA: hypothetical protein VJ761_12285 [Ktedonobacteraceae bacterium]|nr:hypothetical protein [Ktedonobacteraceae bacterium]